MKVRLHKIILAMLLPACLTCRGVNPAQIRFHNEATDTTVITKILIEAADANLTDGELTSSIAKHFLGKPYAAGTLEGEPEMLTVNVDQFDCTTLVETALAMAKTVEERRTSWQDFIYNLEQIRYRGGMLNGYGSRLHYISDWIVDNAHRGNLKEVTDRIANANFATKTLDFMTTNRAKYPAMADDANFAAVKNAEIGYRMHRYPYIRTMNISKAMLREGDVIAITTGMKNLDVIHMGIVTMVDGTPHLLHASLKAGKVIVDSTPLADYVRHNKNATGIRVFRLN